MFQNRNLVGWVGCMGLVFLGGCGFHEEKAPKQQSVVSHAGVVPGYDTLRSTIFEPKCIRCHGRKGGVNLETYASAKEVVEQIGRAVLDEQSMPPSGPLSQSEQDSIRAWINAGAPEQDQQTAAVLSAGGGSGTSNGGDQEREHEKEQEHDDLQWE